MQFLQTISLVLARAVCALALPAAPQVTEAEAVTLENFVISNIYTNTFSDPTNTQFNRTISFLFTDPNSNSTSTICTKSWTQTNSTNTYPTTYSLCDATGNDEAFQWKFDSLTSLGIFSLDLVHGFSDPVNYPPPYDFVEYFTSPTAFNLTCASSQGNQVCYLPAPQTYVNATIDAIAD